MARIVGIVAKPPIAVCAVYQGLLRLPSDVSIVRDQSPERGPLEGVAAASRPAACQCDIAFSPGCDPPLLTPMFIRPMIELSRYFDVCVPHIGVRLEPLPAVYNCRVLSEIEKLLRLDKLRPAFLTDCVRIRRVSAEDFLAVDPDLVSLTSVPECRDS